MSSDCTAVIWLCGSTASGGESSEESTRESPKEDSEVFAHPRKQIIQQAAKELNSVEI